MKNSTNHMSAPRYPSRGSRTNGAMFLSSSRLRFRREIRNIVFAITEVREGLSSKLKLARDGFRATRPQHYPS